MPPTLTIVIYALLVAYLLWGDRKVNGSPPTALWIPLIWTFLAESRFPSQWLNLSAPQLQATAAILEGSPVDSAVFAALIFAGLVVLAQRRAATSTVLANNVWVWLYFVFAAISIFWSEYPDISLRRLIKAVGNLVMVAVILTEPRPYEALGYILRWVAFFLVPLSVVFMKYFPELGRGYHMGVQMITGATTHKNSLGMICLLAGIYFSWRFLFQGVNNSWRLHYPTYIVLIPAIIWLFYEANSATSTACMAVALCLLVVGRQPAVARQPTRILHLTVGLILLFAILEFGFDLSAAAISMLGRRPDLTTRVPMWEDLLAMVENPLVGFGYEGFWLGRRLEFMREKWGITMQAHNGYLEMYLNMGAVGLFFLLAWIVSGVAKIRRHLSIDYPVAVLRLCFLVVVLLYNWTEATFYGVSIMWMILLLAVMYAPTRRPSAKLRERPSPSSLARKVAP